MNEPQNSHNSEEAWTATDLHAVIEEYDDEPDECTILPGGVSPERVTTTWISAKNGSFVPLDENR